MKKVAHADGENRAPLSSPLPIDIPGITKLEVHIAGELEPDAAAGTNAVPTERAFAGPIEAASKPATGPSGQNVEILEIVFSVRLTKAISLAAFRAAAFRSMALESFRMPVPDACAILARNGAPIPLRPRTTGDAVPSVD